MSKHQNLSGHLRVQATSPSLKEGEFYVDSAENRLNMYDGVVKRGVALATTTSTSTTTTTTSTSTTTTSTSTTTTSTSTTTT